MFTPSGFPFIESKGLKAVADVIAVCSEMMVISHVVGVAILYQH